MAQTKEYILTVTLILTHMHSHTRTHHIQAEQACGFLSELRYLQTRSRLFVFPGICKHPQQKQVPPE